MANAGTSHIPLYPELRACTAPAAARILELFGDLTRHELRHDGQIVQTFHPQLSPLQEQVLELLQIPATSGQISRPPLASFYWPLTCGGPNAQREVRNVSCMGGPLGAKQNVMDRPNRTWPSEFPKRSVGGRPAMDESLEARSLSHPGRVSEVARFGGVVAGDAKVWVSMSTDLAPP